MSKNYIIAIIIYDWCKEFERLELACDQTYRLAIAICDEYMQYVDEMNITSCYDTLYDFVDNTISFTELWEKTKTMPDNTVY